MSLVRVRVGDREFNVGAAYAAANKLEVLDEPAYENHGRPRPVTRTDGRPVKAKTSVAEAAAKKKAAESADQSDNQPSEK